MRKATVVFCRKTTSLLQNRQGLASIAFQQFGVPSAVCKIDANNEGGVKNPSSGVTVNIKASEVLMEDLRNIHGLSLSRTSTGVAGETGIGKVVHVDTATDATGATTSTTKLAVNDNVFVVGSGYGTWRNNGKFPTSSVFKIPSNSTSITSAVHLSSSLIAYGLLTKYVKFNKGDIVIQGDKISPISSAITQLGKHLGVKVISASTENYGNFDYLSKLKTEGTIKLGIAYSDAKLFKNIYKAVGINSTVVLYNDSIEQFEDIDGAHLSVSRSVFDNVTIQGFTLTSWVKSDPISFQTALNDVTKLLDDKIITFSTAQSFVHTDYSKAITAASEGKSTVLTF